MIKESFLRNYSTSKIHNQADDHRKRLKVYYMRQGTPLPTQSETFSPTSKSRKGKPSSRP